MFLWLNNIPLCFMCVCVCVCMCACVQLLSRVQLCTTPWTVARLFSWNSTDNNTGVGGNSFLQGIFPTQRSNPCLLHWRWILYRLSHQGNPSNYSLFFHFKAKFLETRSPYLPSTTSFFLLSGKPWDLDSALSFHKKILVC